MCIRDSRSMPPFLSGRCTIHFFIVELAVSYTHLDVYKRQGVYKSCILSESRIWYSFCKTSVNPAKEESEGEIRKKAGDRPPAFKLFSASLNKIPAAFRAMDTYLSMSSWDAHLLSAAGTFVNMVPAAFLKTESHPLKPFLCPEPVS